VRKFGAPQTTDGEFCRRGFDNGERGGHVNASQRERTRWRSSGERRS
jgi:hypothetical protein